MQATSLQQTCHSLCVNSCVALHRPTSSVRIVKGIIQCSIKSSTILSFTDVLTYSPVLADALRAVLDQEQEKTSLASFREVVRKDLLLN